MSSLVALVRRDLALYFSSYFTPMFVAVYALLQTLVFAYVLTGYVRPGFLADMNYLQFYALGSPIIVLSTTAYAVGRDIFRDKEIGYSNYVRSLPVSGSQIALARGLSGAIRSTIHILPLYVLAVLLRPPSIPN